MNKCCSTCCNRINRKLAVLSGHAAAGPTEGSGVGAAVETTHEETSSSIKEETGPATGTAVVAGGPKDQPPTGASVEEETVVEEKMVRPEQVRQEQLLPPHPITMAEPRPVTRILQPGADNSETDSADEMGASQNVNATDAQAIAVANVNMNAASINTTNVNRSTNGNIGQVHGNNVILPPTRVLTGSLLQEALTVRDLVSGVIESQLKRADPHGMATPLGVGSPVYPPGPSESPTITSILKDSQRNYAVGRSTAPLTIVTNTPPAPSPRLMMTAHPEAKQQTILVIDPSPSVNDKLFSF